MDDPLPEEFDVIIIGTGLGESIVSGALSRIGKTVLHIDQNDFYGSTWASFNIKDFEKIICNEGFKSLPKSEVDITSVINENETFLPISSSRQLLSNVSCKCHISEEVSTEVEETSRKTSQNADKDVVDPSLEDKNKSEACDITPQSQEASDDSIQEKEMKAQAGDDTQQDSLSPISDNDKDVPAKEDKTVSSEKQVKLMTRKKFYDEWRRYNIDLSPKLLFSRGRLVELLIQSNVARYLEFRNVTRTLTLLSGDNDLRPVPCSRADVFNSKFVTVIEKRILMRVLTLCANYQDHPEEYEDFKEKPFLEFLQAKKISKKIQQFIVHSIAMIDETSSTLDGLEATRKFLQSLGRYGNSAFLWPMYGSGELPQAFSRLSAVFGGTFCLRHNAAGVVINKDNGNCCAIIDCKGRTIRCKHLITDESNVPDQFRVTFQSSLSRAVYVTNKSVLGADKEQVSLITLPPDGDRESVRLMELGPQCCVCPPNTYLVHAMTSSRNATVFSEVEKIVFKGEDEDENKASEKPAILWSSYFTMNEDGVSRDLLPGNLHVMRGPGIHLGYNKVVDEAKEVFGRISPDEEFLPRAPDPEEIIYDDEGYNTESNGVSAPPQDAGGDYVEEDEDELEGEGNPQDGGGPHHQEDHSQGSEDVQEVGGGPHHQEDQPQGSEDVQEVGGGPHHQEDHSQGSEDVQERSHIDENSPEGLKEDEK